MARTLISVIIPCYNEAANIGPFYKALRQATQQLPYDFEYIYVNDGSNDQTLAEIQSLGKAVRVISLSRNFGKETATTAGIHSAKGDACLMIDADGQHPVQLIPEFIAKWQAGAQVVIGVWRGGGQAGLTKRLGSKLYYRLLKTTDGPTPIPGSTDFRLISRDVQQEFIRLTERNRITRGLIDWLGFQREYIYFKANPRLAGAPTYSLRKLTGLALNSFVSLSPRPLYFAIYCGAVILPLSILLGLFSAIEMLIGDPLDLRITGSAYLVLLALFLIGLVLIAQGITAMYLAHIHDETKNRPLYVVDRRHSSNP